MPENTRGHRRVTLPAPECPIRAFADDRGMPDGGFAAGTLTPMPYEVRTPVFEGPFDLLLHLILKEEVELWEVSLARDRRRVPRRGRAHGPGSTSTSPPSSCSSRRRSSSSRPAACCPGSTTLELDEELLRFEERDLLLARLLECKTFKDAAKVLEGRLRRGEPESCRARAGPEEPFRSLAPDPLERVALDALRAAALRVLAPPPAVEVDTDHVAPIRASVRDAVETVLAPAARRRSR